MPAGEYDIDVYADGADPDTDDPAISADGVAVPGGANVTLVAHLTEGGDPTLSAFVNDTSSIEAGQTRLIVRHTAAAPAVDVRAGERPVIEGLTNPNVEVLNLEAGTVSADVTLAGTDTVVLGPADLDLAEGTNTIVYAWGSAWSAQPVLWLRHANCRPTARPPDLVPLRTTFGASELITCGGPWRAEASSYRDNVVVVAMPVD